MILAACGGDSRGEGSASERPAIEKVSRASIVEDASDEDYSESADALRFESLNVDGDEAEVKATSTTSGNKYALTLRKNQGEWRVVTQRTDVPEEAAGGGRGSRGPNEGPGRSASTDQVESQIEARLLKPLGVKGGVTCPPRVKLRRGNNFDCQVTGGRPGTVKVTQKDDRGNLNFKLSLKAG